MKRVKEILPDAFPGIIYEVIVTTRSRSGEENAAPMGITFTDGDLSELIIRPFKETVTHRNLAETRAGVANITRDPIPFVKYLLRGERESLAGEFEDAEEVDAPRLRGMEAYLEFKVKEIVYEGERAKMLCFIMAAYPGKTRLEPYTRAAYALVEAAINASRLESYRRLGLNVDELLETLRYCSRVIKRTAAGTRFEEAMRALLAESLTSSPSRSRRR